MSYAEFLDRKTQVGAANGFEPIEIPKFLFPFQRDLTAWAIRRGRGAVLASCGLGKGFHPMAPVLTPKGWAEIGSLAVDDFVIGSDGNPVRVLGVYPRGIQPFYRVTFSDGVSVACDSDHLWAVRSVNDVARGKPWRTMATRDLAETQLKYGTHGQSRSWQIPMVSTVEFPEVSLPLDPYFLGVLIGDGALSGGSVSWTKPDVEVATRIASVLPKGVSLKRIDTDGKCTKWSIVSDTTGHGYTNPVTDVIRGLGLMGLTSPDKFVPQEYLIASPAQRLALLQGLMDTDGYAGESPEFSSTSKVLAEAVVFLAQSFGGTASITEKPEPHYRDANGEKHICKPAWRVVPCFPEGINPFHLTRKAAKYKTPSRGLGRWIDSITPIGAAESVCIKVDAEDGLFVAEHFVVTHNTPVQLVWADNVIRHTNKPVLILTPLAVSGQTVREAEKFGISAIQSRHGKVYPHITVTNYEQLKRFNPEDFAGVVADESSCLKSFDAQTTARVTEFMRTIPYRLLCSATPAPNDYIELGTSAEALGEMGYSDMITKFFRQTVAKDHLGWGRTKYILRGHATKDFWRWVCSWARACRQPSDLGYENTAFELPPLVSNEHVVESVTKRKGFLFDIPAESLQDQRKERRRTITERCERVAELVDHKEPAVVWCHLNPEGDTLAKMIPGAVQVSGNDSDESKEEAFLAFAAGQIRVLVSKPVIAAWGLNWQHYAHQTFFPSHSYEQYHQAVRRSWRFGQTRPVVVDVVASEGEAGVVANLQRKADAAEAMFDNLVTLMNDQLKINRTNEFTKQEASPPWLSTIN